MSNPATDPAPSVLRPTITEAYRRIGAKIRRTPLLDLDGVTVKLEFLQHTGSFKPRGAFNRVLSAGRLPSAGLVTASGGNHGAAVAYVARDLRVPATVFVPEVTAEAKRARIASYGATVVVGGAMYDDARRASEAHAIDHGALLVHAYDDPAVVAGQGTVGLELAEQAPDLDTVLVAVGGGGLVGGIAAWYAPNPKVHVVAVEPLSIATLHASLEAGTIVDVEVSGVAADSLGARRIGRISYDICRRTRVESVLVTDDAIVGAQRRLWEDARIVAEPGGATAMAALWSGAYVPRRDERVGVIVCGANCDPGSVLGR